MGYIILIGLIIMFIIDNWVFVVAIIAAILLAIIATLIIKAREEAEAERKRKVAEAERKRKEAEAERIRIVAEMERRRFQAEAEAERKRKEAEAEAERKRKEAEVEAERKRKEAEAERKRNAIVFVKERSVVYKNLLALNTRYEFYNIEELKFEIKCTSYAQYTKFSAVKNFINQFLDNPVPFEKFFQKVEENKKLFIQYKRERNSYYPSATYIESMDLPITKEEFYAIEKELCEQTLKNPCVDIKICYIVKYSSPQGRNQYHCNVWLGEDDIKEAFIQLEAEKKNREKKEIERKIKEEERVEIQAFLKDRKRLQRQADELARREQEFEIATKGHIYATSDKEESIEIIQQEGNVEKDLSTWEKFQRLKKSFENGEITYEEYNEKRKQLI